VGRARQPSVLAQNAPTLAFRPPAVSASHGDGSLHRGTTEAVPDPSCRIEREGRAFASSSPGPPSATRSRRADRAFLEAFTALGADPGVAVIVLQGDGKAFCGGADVNWMRSSLELSEDDNVRDAAAMSDMLRAIDRARNPSSRASTVRRWPAARGCAPSPTPSSPMRKRSSFQPRPSRLIPAVITPFVLAKIGVSHARRMFLTGERFDAACASDRSRARSRPRGRARRDRRRDRPRVRTTPGPTRSPLRRR